MKIYNVIEEKKIIDFGSTCETIKSFGNIIDAKYYMDECAYEALDSHVSCIHDNPLGKYTLEKSENRISVSCPAPNIGYNSYDYYIEENDIGPISIPVYIVQIEKIDFSGNITSHSIVKAFYDLSDAKNYCESEMQDYLYDIPEAKTKTISNDDKALQTYKIMLPSNNIINITINEIVTK